MNLIKQLAGKHEFTVLTPLHPDQKSLLDVAKQTCKISPVWLPEAPPPRSRQYYQLNAWRQAFFDRQPRLVKEFSSPLIQQAVDAELSNSEYELIQVQQLYMVQYLPRKIKRPTVLDVDNLWSKLVNRQANLSPQRFTQRLQTRLDLRKVPGYEKRSLQRFAGLLAISPDEEQMIQNLAPKAQTAVIPNGVDCDFFGQALPPSLQADFAKESRADSPILLFTGTMAYEPNADAVRYFAQEIFPMIRKSFPRAIFRIVGRDPLPAVRALSQDPQIQVTGFVEDIRPTIAECDIFVVPLRAGAGTRLKILEALAMGKGVVTTSLGAEGLDVQDGEDLLIADKPLEFAQAVLTLINQPELAQSLGQNGRHLVAKFYDWKPIAARLEQLYENLSYC